MSAEMVWVALSTVASEADAERLAHRLVSERRVACVSILPGVLSVYEWKGVIERTREWMLVMKLPEALRQPLKEVWPDLHPYDVPELLMMKADDGHAPYMHWVLSAGNAENGFK